MRTCSYCGEENPDKFRFCGACGKPLAEAAGREARKIVTCVFSDVTGSTALGESLDPESIRAIMTRYFESMRAVLESHGGTVEKFVGDAVMAVFGIPEVHEDDALRAVRAAVDMKAELATLGEELEARYGTGIKVRIGVNTGEVLAGDASQGHAFASGDTVNLAARLEQAAPPGEILVGEATYRLVRDAVEAEAVEPLELKGKAEPQPAWRLLGVTDARYGRSRQLSSALVGRDDELRALREAFDAAVAERACKLVTVIGPAGIGKTRLTLEFLERVGNDATIIQGRCLSYGEGMTFWPVGESVRDAAGIADDDPAHIAIEKIEALVPGEESSTIARTVAAAIGVSDESRDVQEAFWGIRKLFEALGSERPVIVVYDDIHWGEPTFLDLLEYLASFSADAPLLVVALARPDLLQTRADWVTSAGSNLITLSPLTEDDTEALIGNLLDSPAISEEVRALIKQATDGNPLFVEEVLRMLVDDELLVKGENGWAPVRDITEVSIPPTINALIASRLDRLTPEEREVIQRAGVVGLVFWWGAVTELCPQPLQPRVGSFLQRLARRDLIHPESSSFFNQDAFRFGHVLIREAAYNSMPKALRAELHERFADWLVRVAGDGSTEHDEILGYHLEQAHRYKSDLGLAGAADDQTRERAAEHLLRAGRRSLDRQDMPAAANLLGRAWALRGTDPGKIPELAYDLTTTLVSNGQIDAARAIVEEAQSLVGEDEVLTAYVAFARLPVAEATGSEGSMGDMRRKVDGWIDLFRARGDEDALITALTAKGWAYWVSNEMLKAQAAWEEALPLAAGKARLEIPLLAYLGTALAYGPLPATQALARSEEILKRVEGSRYLETSALIPRPMLLAIGGRFDEARRLARELHDLEEEFGLKLQAASMLGQYIGVIEELAGNLNDAERYLRESCEVLGAMGDRGFLSTGEALLAQTLCSQGRWDEAVEMSKTAEAHGDLEDVSTQHLWRAARARAYAHQGRAKEAVALAREAWVLVEPTDVIDVKIRTLMDLAEVIALAGDQEEARHHLQEALTLSREREHKVYEREILKRLEA